MAACHSNSNALHIESNYPWHVTCGIDVYSYFPVILIRKVFNIQTATCYLPSQQTETDSPTCLIPSSHPETKYHQSFERFYAAKSENRVIIYELHLLQTDPT